MKRSSFIFIALGALIVWTSAMFKLMTENLISEYGFREQITNCLKKRCHVIVLWSDVVFNTDPNLARDLPDSWQVSTLKTGIYQNAILEHINRSEIVHIGRSTLDGKSKIMFETSQGFEFTLKNDNVSILDIMPEGQELELAGDLYHWHNFKPHKVTGSWDTYGLNPNQTKYFLPFREMKILAVIAAIRNNIKFLIAIGAAMFIAGLFNIIGLRIKKSRLKRRNIEKREERKQIITAQVKAEIAPTLHAAAVLPSCPVPDELELYIPETKKVNREDVRWLSDNQREFLATKEILQTMLNSNIKKITAEERESLLDILAELESGKRSVKKARYSLRKAQKIIEGNGHHNRVMRAKKHSAQIKPASKQGSEESSDLPLLSGREIINVLVGKFGYKEMRRATSHRRLIHKHMNNVSVPIYSEVDRKLLRQILSEAKITLQQFLEAIG